jgi:hypothetical protein
MFAESTKERRQEGKGEERGCVLGRQRCVTGHREQLRLDLGHFLLQARGGSAIDVELEGDTSAVCFRQLVLVPRKEQEDKMHRSALG